jgi:threonine/homoserine/homoserine lactone efflux protein
VESIIFDTTTLIAFLAASLAIIVAPGPAQALVLARSISEGRRSGILTAVGLNTGTIVHACAAAFGLSAILANSALAFAFVKYLGAAYLILLGIQALLTNAHPEHLANPAAAKPWQAFMRAVATGVLNPKVAIFFLAFLPQFVDPSRGYVFWQFLTLGLILAVMDILYESVLASAAGALSQWLARSLRMRLWRQRVTGLTLVGLGIRMALTRRE